MKKYISNKFIIVYAIRLCLILLLVSFALLFNANTLLYVFLAMGIALSFNFYYNERSEQNVVEKYCYDIINTLTYLSVFIVLSCYAIIPSYILYIFIATSVLYFALAILLRMNAADFKEKVFFSYSNISLFIGIFMYFFIELFGYLALGFTLFGLALLLAEVVYQIIENYSIIKYILLRK